jgi:hypothetical protein
MSVFIVGVCALPVTAHVTITLPAGLMPFPLTIVERIPLALAPGRAFMSEACHLMARAV